MRVLELYETNLVESDGLVRVRCCSSTAAHTTGWRAEAPGCALNWIQGAIDDATGKVVGAVFRQCEDAQGYFLVMRHVVSRYGIPETVYRDRHGIFERGPKRSGSDMGTA